MPSGAIKQQDGVRALAARRADRADEIGVFVALIGRLAWPRAALGPLPNKAVLLADASFIFT
jgi:hypothetical protein